MTCLLRLALRVLDIEKDPFFLGLTHSSIMSLVYEHYKTMAKEEELPTGKEEKESTGGRRCRIS